MRVFHCLLSVAIGVLFGIVTVDLAEYVFRLPQDELAEQFYSFDLSTTFWQLILTGSALFVASIGMVYMSRSPQASSPPVKTFDDEDDVVMTPIEQRNDHVLRIFVDDNAVERTDGQSVADLSGRSTLEHVRDVVAANLGKLESGLALFADRHGVDGVAYPTPVGPIDVLATRPGGGLAVIVVSDGVGDSAICGRLLAQMSWVGQHLGRERPAGGIIVTRYIPDSMRYAASQLPHVRIFTYDLDVHLREADRPTVTVTNAG